eukprot:352239-Chlamydomonas_euryale.AAC.12
MAGAASSIGRRPCRSEPHTPHTFRIRAVAEAAQAAAAAAAGTAAAGTTAGSTAAAAVAGGASVSFRPTMALRSRTDRLLAMTAAVLLLLGGLVLCIIVAKPLLYKLQDNLSSSLPRETDIAAKWTTLPDDDGVLPNDAAQVAAAEFDPKAHELTR